VAGVVQAFPRPDLPSLRWTTPDQWHVTLRFLGEVTAAHDVADALRHVPGTLSGNGIGAVHAAMGPASAWFSGRRVLEVDVEGLDALAATVATITAAWGEPPDDRRFRGHLTLARTRGPSPGPVNLSGISIKAQWPVGEIVLFSSTLAKAGARYRALTTVGLGP
jgi:RNA 2',3'-cyclic 3'-phosphodiesterase